MTKPTDEILFEPFPKQIEFLEKKVWTSYFCLYTAYKEFLTKNGL